MRRPLADEMGAWPARPRRVLNAARLGTMMRMSATDRLTNAHDLHRAGRLDAAADAYRAVLEAEPEHPAACLGLALIEMDRGRAEQATDLLERAARREPEAADIIFHLARARAGLGDRERARRGYLEAAALARSDLPLTLLICRMLVREGMAQEALACLRDAPATVEVLDVVGEAQLALADYPAAAAALARAAELAPGRPQAWRLLSVARARVRDYQGAVTAFESFLRLLGEAGDSRARAAAFLAYADLLLMARRPEDARAAIERALALGADQAGAQIVAAKCARLAGDTAKTLEHLALAIEQQPASGEAWQLRLELEAPDALPELAARCSDLALNSDVPVTDRCLLAYAAGRAFDRAGEYGRAFAEYAVANRLQRQDQAARGLHYDREATERLFERYLSEFTPAAMAPPHGADASSIPIFVLGMPRSGTTLVERILGGLDDVRLGGENEALEFIATRYYWERDRGRRPPAAEATPEAWAALAQEYWRRSGVSPCRMTDKMPHNFRHVGLLLAIFPAARVVYLNRDPRDTCLSIFARMFPDGHLYATDLEDLAHYFAQGRKLMLGWQARHPANILEVGYEALIADPVAETRRIADFCGLAWRADCLEFHERAHASFTFSEVQVREPLNDRGVGAWRRYGRELTPLVEGLKAAGITLP